MRRRHLVTIAALVLCAPGAAAQVIEVAADLRVGEVPESPGTGVPIRWVRGFFAGFPFHIDDARDLLDGNALVPAFDAWCGALPYVDFGNRATPDSLGRGAPTLLCAPFLDAREPAEVSCRRLPRVPAGTYWRNGGAAMRARGALAIRAPGTYTFAWGHDDGMSFRIGPTEVFTFPEGTAPRIDVASVRFETAGLYPFTLEWFDGVGGALLDWYITPGVRGARDFSNFTFALVRTEDLYPLDARDCTARCEPCALPTPVCDREAGRCVGCIRDRDCGARQQCREGACLAPPSTPDAGPICDGHCDDVERDARTDAFPADGDATREPMLPPSVRGGCGCTASRSSVRGGVAILLGLVVRSRRRRSRRAPNR